MKTSSAREIHKKAEDAREFEQDFPKAMRLINQAIVEYEKEKDCKGLSEAYGSAVIIYKHLYQKGRSEKYKDLAKHAAKQAVIIARNCDDKTSLALPYFNLADYYDTVEEDCVEAAKYYKVAIKYMQKYPPKSHDRPAVLMNMQAHLCACEYRNGDKNAIDRLVGIAGKIEESEEAKYERDVWSSGAYMKAADLLREDDPKTAKIYLKHAKNIIDANSDLVLRKRQWKKFSGTF